MNLTTPCRGVFQTDMYVVVVHHSAVYIGFGDWFYRQVGSFATPFNESLSYPSWEVRSGLYD